MISYLFNPYKNKRELVIYSIIFVLLFLIFFIIIKKILNYNNTEKFKNTKKIGWSQNRCFFTMNETINNIFDKYNIEKDNENWDIYLPCSYDEINKEIKNMPIKNNKKYFIVANSDEMVAKDFLWKNVLSYHGMDKTLTMMPKSYILYDSNDITRFNDEFDDNKIYIMKKNIQRQEGLKITKNKNDILNGYNNGYVIVQELLQNPYTIDNRKINMRFYILITVDNLKMSVYVYNDGFMYYTKDKFIKNSIDFGPNITTGYIDRIVYKTNPLTHKDLRKYLDVNEKKIDENELISDTVFNRINKLLSDIFISFDSKLISGRIQNNYTFQLFGIDISIDNKLEPMIMEINKGPDMGAKDKRDSELKHNVVEDLLEIVGVINTGKKNGFIKIL